MINRVVEFLKKYDLTDKTIIVGFSGGYDSMCLLDILSKIKEMPQFIDLSVVAAHFNHNWRGEESLKEQEICRLFAASRGVDFYTDIANPNIKKTENDARIARYKFFEEAYEEYDADAVFTAHNKDDNAETVLYRIIKGTGIVGLKGIAEKRKFFYRPLLKISREEILNYCERNNLTPNNDSSNSDITYKRNYLRLSVLPALEKVNENVKDSLNTLASNAINDNEIIEEYLQNIRPLIYDEDKIIPSEYKKLSKPVKMRLLYEFIINLGLDYDSSKICDIYDFLEENTHKRNGSTISLASALWLYADDKIVETIPRKETGSIDEIPSITIESEGEYNIGGKIFTLKKYNDSEIFVFPEATSNFAYIDISSVKFPLTIRTRQDGDTISPFGMKGSMKLKKYMNSKGVLRHKRDEILLLCKDSDVLWVSGVGISSKIGVKDKPTHVIEVK